MGKLGKMYTTSEVAEALGYTRQYIGKTIRELSLDIQKEGNSYLLTAKQANKIAEHLGCDAIFTSSSVQEEEEVKGSDDALSAVIETLREQLEQKDKQIERLQAQIDTLLDTNKALSTSHAIKNVAETKELLIADSTEEKPKGFWSRLFNK